MGREEMSDNLLIETAESLCESLQDGDDDYAEERQIIRDLIAEINRLRAQVENCHAAKNLHVRRSEKLQEQLAAKDSLNSDLMANCNQLRERCWKAESELDRWQKIAIEERSWLLLLETDILDLPLRENYANQTEKYHDRATKELNLQVTQEAGYVERLESAYITDSMQSEELAQAALDRIREGT